MNLWCAHSLDIHEGPYHRDTVHNTWNNCKRTEKITITYTIGKKKSFSKREMHIFYAHFAQINEVKWIDCGIRGDGNITNLAAQVPRLLRHPVDSCVQGITPVLPARLKQTWEGERNGWAADCHLLFPKRKEKIQGTGFWALQFVTVKTKSTIEQSQCNK